jgi:hypothetical protein
LLQAAKRWCDGHTARAVVEQGVHKLAGTCAPLVILPAVR